MSFAEAQYHDEDLLAILGEAESGLRGIVTLSTARKQERLKGLEKSIEEARRKVDAIEVEAKSMINEGERRAFQRKVTGYRARIRKLEREIGQVRTQGIDERTALLGEEKPTPKDEPRKANSWKRNYGERAIAIQDDSLSSIARSIKLINDTEEVGHRAGEQLKQQTEQFVKMQEELDHMESNLERGRREIAAFMRRTATDKLILFFVALLILALLAAVVVKLVVDYIVPLIQKKKNS